MSRYRHDLNATATFGYKRMVDGAGAESAKSATAQQALEKAQLNWKVEKRALYLKNKKAIPSHMAVVRTDTGEPLGVVGNRYQPVQNKEAFAFFDKVVGEGRAIYTSAGYTGGGKRIWISAKLPGEMRIKGTEDVTRKYLLLVNSHDATGAVKILYTPLRIACYNMLDYAMREGEQRISIRHTGSISYKISEAQRALGLAVRFFDEFADLANHLAKVSVKDKAVKRFIESLYPKSDDETKERKNERIRDIVFRRYSKGRANQLKGIRGTAWAAYNAVAEHVDHGRRVRGTDDEDRTRNRFASAAFGFGAMLKRQALSLAQEVLVKAS